MSDGRAGSERRLVLPLQTWLILSHLAVLGLPLFALLVTGALAADLEKQTQGDLMNQAALLSMMTRRELERAPGVPLSGLEPVLTPLLVEVRDATLAGIRILDREGVVVATSGAELGEDISEQPEIAAALAGELGVEIRPRARPTRAPLSSRSRRARVRVFVATPIEHRGEVVGAVLLSRTPREELQALYQMAPRLSWGLLASLIAALGLAFFYGYLFSRSLRRLASAAYRISEGELDVGVLPRLSGSHVSDVAGLARAFSVMTARLRGRLTYISEFAGNVAHEFRTPIATVRGSVELIRDDAEMPPGQRALFLDNALAELDRLERLLTGLLSLARAEESGARDRLSVAELIAEIEERYPEIEARVPRDVHLRGDRSQLLTAVNNLVENALHHGGDDAEVLVGVRAARGEVQIEVLDDGPGISPANLDRIFERFFTTDRAGGGTGIGLALVSAVCASHGGRVEVESRPGRTCFRLVLPADEPTASAVAERAGRAEPSEP